MVVDDTSDDLMLFQRAVNQGDTVREIKLTEARSAETALRKMALPSVVPDLIFLDLHLAELSGMDLLQMLKESERTRHVPVIILTGNENGALIKAAISEGASSYIFKDGDPEVYFSALRAVLVYWVDYHQVPPYR